MVIGQLFQGLFAPLVVKKIKSALSQIPEGNPLSQKIFSGAVHHLNNWHAGGSVKDAFFPPSWHPIIWEELIYWQSMFWLYLATYMLSLLIFIHASTLRVSNCFGALGVLISLWLRSMLIAGGVDAGQAALLGGWALILSLLGWWRLKKI